MPTAPRTRRGQRRWLDVPPTLIERVTRWSADHAGLSFPASLLVLVDQALTAAGYPATPTPAHRDRPAA